MATDTRRWTCKVARFISSTFFKLHPDPDEVAAHLNRLGNEGWELVTVIEGYGVPSPMFYLKRPA